MEHSCGVFDKANMISIRGDHSIDILYPGIKIAKPVLGYVQDYFGNYKFVVMLKNDRLKYIDICDIDMWWSNDTVGRNVKDHNLSNHELHQKIFDLSFWN